MRATVQSKSRTNRHSYVVEACFQMSAMETTPATPTAPTTSVPATTTLKIIARGQAPMHTQSHSQFHSKLEDSNASYPNAFALDPNPRETRHTQLCRSQSETAAVPSKTSSPRFLQLNNLLPPTKRNYNDTYQRVHVCDEDESPVVVA